MAEAVSARPSRAARTILAVDGLAGRRWFLPVVAVFPIADYLLPVLPNQLLIIALSSLRQALWWRLALVFAAAGGLGALAMALAVRELGPALLDRLAVVQTGDAANTILEAVRTHGLWALTAIALIPATPRTAVIICALAGLSPLAIGLAVMAGRCVPMTLLAAGGAMAPGLLRRVSSVDRILREVDGLRKQPPLQTQSTKPDVAVRRKPCSNHFITFAKSMTEQE